MTASISEVLETMFYMPLEFDEYGDVDRLGMLDIPDLRLCRLEFSGKFTGYFIMMIPEDILVSMASDFMGEDRHDITREHCDGIIKETLNMVAGHMFSTMDDKSEIRLSIPEIFEDSKMIDTIKSSIPEGLVIAESIEGYIFCMICLND